MLKADVYAVLTSYDENGDYVLKIDLIPLNAKYKELKTERILKSRIPENLRLKAAREFYEILKEITLKSEVLRVLDDGSAVISSGQWHGLEAESYSTAAGNLKIKNVSRYSAVAEGGSFSTGQVIEFKLIPDLEKYIKRINYEIAENTVRKHGSDGILDKRDGRIKESIQGTCVINQGANFCLPGYGSVLSVEYMGIEKAKTDYAGVLIALSLTAVHLGLVPVMTDFDVKFIPWMRDSGRTDRMERLNYFMWGSLPFTFTASFFNQLAYNYKEKKMLPPQFADHDISAAALSLLIPGGGLFYKGYRWAGWGLYMGEISLAGYASYVEDKNTRSILLVSLGVFKCAEFLASYFIPQSYDFYKREVSSADDVDFSAGISKNKAGDSEITASLTLRY